MEPIKCFFLEPTATVRISLRRYARGDENCPGAGYHNAMHFLTDAPALWVPREGQMSTLAARPEQIPQDDPRWPTVCACGYVFTEADECQVFQDLLYQRLDTNELLTLRDAPVGALWYSDWLLHEGSDRWRGPDGHSLSVMVPSPRGRPHEWMVDGRAANCTLPNDAEHRCWVRHGDPRTGDVHVDKSGLTCKAGAGSIQTSDWHGYLTNGYLQEQR